MRIRKGQRLKINHRRKEMFVAVALRDFDPEETDFFPVALVEGYVSGINTGWSSGEEVSCRASLVEAVEIL